MSFYGNSYSEFQKFFYSFIFKNSDLTELSCTPQMPKDELILEGDSWIGFTQKNNSHFLISHKNSEYQKEFSQEYPAIEVTQSLNGNEPQQLIAGQTLKVPILEYDEKGHLWKATFKYYKLPQTQTEIDVSNLKEQMAELEKQGEKWDANQTQASTNIVALQKQMGNFETLKFSQSQNFIEKGVSDIIGESFGEQSYNTNLSRYLNEKFPIERTISEALSSIIEQLSDIKNEFILIKEVQASLIRRVDALEKTK